MVLNGLVLSGFDLCLCVCLSVCPVRLCVSFFSSFDFLPPFCYKWGFAYSNIININLQNTTARNSLVSMYLKSISLLTSSILMSVFCFNIQSNTSLSSSKLPEKYQQRLCSHKKHTENHNAHYMHSIQVQYQNKNYYKITHKFITHHKVIHNVGT